MRRKGGASDVHHQLLVLKEENSKLKEMSTKVSEFERLKMENKKMRIELQKLRTYTDGFPAIIQGQEQDQY